MKSLALASVALIVSMGSASAQEFAFLSDTRDELIFWSPNGGETRRLDVTGLLGSCDLGRRFFQNLQADPATGRLFGTANQCGGQEVELYMIDVSTGDAQLLGTESGLGLPLYSLQRSFLVSSATSLGNLARFNSEIESSSAVASALEIQLPVDGSSNRVGLTSGAFGNEQAFGVSYARVQGSFDVGFAYAQGDGGRNAGKVSVGFSW